MYIKLGESSINYAANTTSSFMIVSELIDSGLSYEKPVLVRTVEELDIWFTQDFEERDYLIELLNKRINLYLYKPISTDNKSNIPDQLDYESYAVINFFGKGSENEPIYVVTLQYIEEFKTNDGLRFRNSGTGNKYYRWDWNTQNFIPIEPRNVDNYVDWYIGEVIPEFNFSGSDPNIENLKIIKTNDNIKVYVQVKDGVTEPYIWFDNQFVSASLLPQNLENTSSSLNLRSTLLLTPGNTDKFYSHPDYMTGETELGIYSTENIEFKLTRPEDWGLPSDTDFRLKLRELSIKENPDYYEINIDKIWSGYQTYMYDLKITDFPNGSYFILPRPKKSQKGILFYRADNDSTRLKIMNELGYTSGSSLYFDVMIRVNENQTITSIFNSLTGNSQFRQDYPIAELKASENKIINLGCVVKSIEGSGNMYVSGKTLYVPRDSSVSGSNINIPEISNTGTLYPVLVTEFTNIESVTFINRSEVNETVVYEIIEDSEEGKGIEFWSKTIGGTKSYDIEGDIKVEIERLELNYYRIRISRYDYLEVFEGYTSGVFGNERLDFQITNGSKLVYCNLYNPDLKEGTYTLKGGYIEETTPSMWQKSLSLMFDEDNEPVWPDFYLIPNIQNYIDLVEYYSSEYLPIYKTFLDIGTKFSTQFLIQNSDLDNDGYVMVEVETLPSPLQPKTIYMIGNGTSCVVTDENGNEINDDSAKLIYDKYTKGNEYYTNYTKDTSNYLIYFYRDMSIYGNPRPGYYAFLEGLLSNNYTISSKVILYKQPTDNPYEEETMDKTLMKYKSNYLVCNNQFYYYKRYFNGDNPYMTLWMRFTAGKINRELQKNKRDYIGIKFSGKMEKVITTIFQTIEESFQIVRKIDMTNFNIDELNNTLTINLNIYVNDLMENNLNLNITINYNNKNNYGIS